jgi:NADPH:quinone reductase-like Zn-dependent oxidoreductase
VRGLQGFVDGAFAEFVAAPAGRLARKPASLTFAQAAAVPLAAVTALQGLRRGGLAAGQHVLVIGASGGVGTLAVQIAKDAGAEVTGVCSTGRLELVRDLGADHVIDYTAQDPASGPAAYDLILQLGGRYSPRALRRVLTPAGTLVQSGGDGNRWLGPLGAIATGALLNLVTKQRIEGSCREAVDGHHLHRTIFGTSPPACG